MKKEIITVPVQLEAVKLLTDVTYAQPVSWFDQSFRPLKMDLLMPKHGQGHAPLPLIVWICGGGFVTMDKDIWVPEMIEYARRGFVVASIEYRTSNEAPFPAQIQDVKAAIRYLRAHAAMFCIDPDRVAVMGESAGGHLASMAGVTGNIRDYDVGEYLQESSAVQAVVDIYGVVDVWSSSPQPEPSYMTMLLGAPAETVPEKAREASPLYRVDAHTPPFMILHGTEDDMVDPEQSDRLARALEENGVPCTYVVLQGARHGDDAFYQAEVKERVVKFLHSVWGEK